MASIKELLFRIHIHSLLFFLQCAHVMFLIVISNVRDLISYLWKEEEIQALF